MATAFKFSLFDKVTIDISNERGEVVGRAEYPASENSYLMRYKATDGRAVESWWNESALSRESSDK